MSLNIIHLTTSDILFNTISMFLIRTTRNTMFVPRKKGPSRVENRYDFKAAKIEILKKGSNFVIVLSLSFAVRYYNSVFYVRNHFL